jgi:hypothetical protein
MHKGNYNTGKHDTIIYMSQEEAAAVPNPQGNLKSPHPGILSQTLGEVLRNHPEAQKMIMKSMKITPEQFKQLLGTAGDNQYMNMTIGDLFKSGFIQQAQMQAGQAQKIVSGQAPPGQLQQMTPVEVVVQSVQPKQSLLQRLRGLFK